VTEKAKMDSTIKWCSGVSGSGMIGVKCESVRESKVWRCSGKWMSAGG